MKTNKNRKQMNFVDVQHFVILVDMRTQSMCWFPLSPYLFNRLILQQNFRINENIIEMKIKANIKLNEPLRLTSAGSREGPRK